MFKRPLGSSQNSSGTIQDSTNSLESCELLRGAPDSVGFPSYSSGVLENRLAHVNLAINQV
eukprot:5787044-Pyramimonas_sp.AAC.1